MRMARKNEKLNFGIVAACLLIIYVKFDIQPKVGEACSHYITASLNYNLREHWGDPEGNWIGAALCPPGKSSTSQRPGPIALISWSLACLPSLPKRFFGGGFCIKQFDSTAAQSSHHVVLDEMYIYNQH